MFTNYSKRPTILYNTYLSYHTESVFDVIDVQVCKAILGKRILKQKLKNPIKNSDTSIHIFPLALMGVLAPGSAHARPSAQPPIDMSGNFPAHVSAESPSKFSKKNLKKPKNRPQGAKGGAGQFFFLPNFFSNFFFTQIFIIFF